MTNLNDFLKRSWKTIVIVFVFAGILLIGLVIYDDYGIAYDETIERTTTFVNLKYILETIHPQIRLPEVFDEIPDLAEWKDRYYGVAVQLPAAMIEWMTGFKFSQFTICRIRHLWIFLQFYAALIFFFLLLRRRFASVRTAIIGVLLLWLSPRIFSDAFYNIKDLPFLSWIVISLYFMFRWLENRLRRYLILFSIVSAVAINIRIVGGMLIAVAVGILISQLLRKEKLPKTVVAEALTIFFVSAAVWILITPLAWKNPILVLGDTLRTFSSYPHYTRELYFGKRYLNTQLPWHYLPVWIGITTPVLVIFSFLACLLWETGTFVWRFFNGDKPRNIAGSTIQKSFDRGILALIFIPILFTILFHSPIYNGWRHFYFAYPWIVYFAVDWIDRLSKSRFSFVRAAIFSLVGMSLIYNASWIIRVHPYQFIYFNEVFPRNIRTGFEKDY